MISPSRMVHRQLNLLLIPVSVTGAFVGGARVAPAALLVYEPFNYAAGVVLDQTAATGLNLTGAYAALDPSLPAQFQLAAQSPGLTYGNLTGGPSADGNRLSQASGTTAGGATVNVDQEVVAGPGQAIYFSAVFTFDDSQNGTHRAHVALTDDDSGDELMFGEAAVGIRSLRVSADTVATGGLVAAGADNAFTDGQTLLLAGRYINSAAANSDVLELVGYDTADAEALPSSFDPTDPNAEFAYALTDLEINLAKVTSVTFVIRGNGNNFIDELRIGSTYASVIPEPSAVILLMTGLWSALFVTRRR